MSRKLEVEWLIWLLVLTMPAVRAQPPARPSGQPHGPRLPQLRGDDEMRAKQLDEQIDRALKTDRWDEAIAPAEELVALRARTQGPNHFETVSAQWRLKKLRRVAPLPKQDRAAALLANGMNERARGLYAQGKYKEAQPLFETALETFRRLLTDDHPDTATSYNNLAVNVNAQARYGQAEPLLEKALAIRRRLLTDDHPDTAESCNNLGMNLNAQGKYGQAQPLLEKALEIRRRLLTDDHPDAAASYNNLAYNLNYQGNYAQAQPLLEKALEIRRHLLTDDDPGTAASYNNLAYNLNSQGKYAQAQPLFEKALEIFRRRLTDDHPNTATAFSTLAYNLNSQGKYAQAQPFYEKALQIDRRRLTDDHPHTARSYNNLAYNLNAQGEYTAAKPLLEKALEIYRRLLGDDHPITATSYLNLGMNLSVQGKYSQAQPLLAKALRIRSRLLTGQHPATAASYSDLAGNLKAQGKYMESLDQLAHAARGFEEARVSAAFSGLDRATATSKSDPMPHLAAGLARIGQPSQAWERLEEGLGRGLLDELAARQDKRLTSRERAEIRQRVVELERLDRLFDAPLGKISQAEQQKRFEELRRRRDRAQIAVSELRAELVSKHGALAGKVAPLSEVQSSLPADVALVAWVDIPPLGPNAADPDGDHWGVVVRSRGIPAWFAIAGTGSDGLWTKDDTRLANLVRKELRSRPGTGPADMRPLFHKLRAQRLAPLAGALGATPDGLPPAHRLIVLPSRAMTGIPVEVLLADADTQTVSYAASATVYKYLREQPRHDLHAGLLALGDPVYERPDGSTEPKRRKQESLLAAGSTDGDLAPLPGTRPEVEALARLFGSADRPARALLGAEASEPELDRIASSGELGRFAFIHLAAHGVIDEAIPERSAVILTQTGIPDPLEQVLNHKRVFDGRLSVREIQRTWDLKAELVTLSACETALGRESGGEGYVGFTQALLMSGARSVCLSLWKVDDKATSLLMTRFYQNILGKRPGLSKPMPKAEALREAKAWLRGLTTDAADAAGSEAKQVSRGGVRPLQGTPVAIHPYEHPHYWAAFVLVGDPD